MSQHQTYDYIIAGAGSAGCALAARLCEDPGITVCLVEAGGNGNSLFVRMPAGYRQLQFLHHSRGSRHNR
jgi:choline dehydrogenase-like flavoprotein